jgi:hypothetical protein
MTAPMAEARRGPELPSPFYGKESSARDAHGALRAHPHAMRSVHDQTYAVQSAIPRAHQLSSAVQPPESPGRACRPSRDAGAGAHLFPLSFLFPQLLIQICSEFPNQPTLTSFHKIVTNPSISNLLI